MVISIFQRRKNNRFCTRADCSFPLDRIVTLFSNNETLVPIILDVYSYDQTDGIFGPWSLRFMVKSLGYAS